MKKYDVTKDELHQRIKALPRMSYRIKIKELLDEKDYLVFTFKEHYYGYVYHCSDGFLLERVFDKMIDPSSINYDGISYGQFEFIKKWYEESKNWLRDGNEIERKLDYIQEVNQLRYLLEEKKG